MPGYADRITAFAPSVKPWECQPGETHRQFQAFQIYRDAEPATRTHRLVVMKLFENIPLTNAVYGPAASGEKQKIWSAGRENYIREIASKKQWRYRAALFDADRDRLRMASAEKEMVKAARRHAAALQVVSAALMTTVNFTLQISQEAIDDYRRRIEKARASGKRVPVKIIRELQEICQANAALLPRVHKAEREALAIAVDQTPEETVPEPVVNEAAKQAEALLGLITDVERASLDADFADPTEEAPAEPPEPDAEGDAQPGDDDEPPPRPVLSPPSSPPPPIPGAVSASPLPPPSGEDDGG